MSPLELLASETREWLKRARADAAAAEALSGANLTEEALFHCQQCAEKAIKAVLTWNQQPFPKTHDLSDLRALCEQASPMWKARLDGVDSLTQYAWRFRYPGASYLPSDEEAKAALATARRVLASIEQYLRPIVGD